MKPVSLVKRIEALEERVAAKVPCREPKTHTVHGATRQERDAAMRAMIEAGEAAPDDIFFLIVPAGDRTIGGG